MSAPEHLLPLLNAALRELHGASQAMEVQLTPDEDAEFMSVLRRLLLAEVMGNIWTIAIAGSQGAGKTTLLCTMYGMTGGPEAWLVPNEGRGERMPVLIQECDGLSEPEGWASFLRAGEDKSNPYRKVDEPLSRDEFRAACRGDLAGVLLPILKVPRRFFAGQQQAFVLLPGYEQAQRHTRLWQELMRQALISSAGCIVVSDQTRLANQEQRAIAADMRARELRGCEPVVVLMKTEGKADRPEDLDELRRTAAEVFALGADQWRHVICAGEDTSQTLGYTELWLPHLRRAIHNASAGTEEFRRAQLVRLRETLHKDLARVEQTLRARVALKAHGDGGSAEGAQALKRLTEEFDQASATLRESHSTAVKRLLAEHASKAGDRMRDTLAKDYDGIFNKVHNTFEKVNAAESRLRQDIKLAWMPSRENTLLVGYTQELGNLTQKQLGLLPARFDSADVLQKLGYVDGNGETVSSAVLVDEGRRADLVQLFHSAAGQLGQRTGKELEATVRLLPAMALEYVRIASLVPSVTQPDAWKQMQLPQSDLHGSIRKVQADFGDFNSAAGKLVGALGVLLAVDVAVDGEADLLQAVSTLLGLETAGTATAGSPLLAGAMVAGAALFLAHSVLQQVRQYDLRVSGVASAMIENIRDHWEIHLMAHYDQVMATIRRQLVTGLRRRYDLDQALVHQDRFAKAMADVRVLRRELLECIAQSGHALDMLTNTGDA